MTQHRLNESSVFKILKTKLMGTGTFINYGEGQSQCFPQCK